METKHTPGPYGDGTPYPSFPRRITVDGREYRLTDHGDVYARFDLAGGWGRRTTIERRLRFGGPTHRRVNLAYAAAIAKATGAA